jgi:hypothetical protein
MTGRSVARVPGWIAISLVLIQCQGKEYRPAFPEKAAFKVHHLGTYSTKLAGVEEKEVQGTIFQTRLSYRMEKQGSGWLVHRRLDTLVARGYHKLSMPNELEKKVDITVKLDSSRQPVSVSGYDSLARVLGRIEQKEDFRKQLLKGGDSAYFAAWTRDWWRLLAFLPQDRELIPHESLPVQKANMALATVTLDSARFDGVRLRGTNSGNKRNCLEYTLDYHRTDSLPLLVEQFFFSAAQNRKYRKYSWKPGTVKGFLQFSVDRESGMPCFHSRTEIGDITLEYKEDKAEVPIQLFRYEEDIYEY